MLMIARKMKQQCKLGKGSHSFSSGFWGSNILTCVKGNSPFRPLTSPSHWPFIFILVTFTTSPTCVIRNKKNPYHTWESQLWYKYKSRTTHTSLSRGKKSCPLLGRKFNWKVTFTELQYQHFVAKHNNVVCALSQTLNYTCIYKDYWTTPLFLGKLTASCNSIFSLDINSHQ